MPIARTMRSAGWIGPGLKNIPMSIGSSSSSLPSACSRTHTWAIRRTSTLNQIFARLEIKFHGVRLNQQGWGDDDHSLAVTIRDPEGGLFCHLIFNAYWEPLEFELPASE